MKLLNKIKLKSRLTCLVKHKDKRLKPIKAFTLIELLVVIAIIGILASVVVVNVGSARVKARDAKRISDMKAIQTALEMYYDDNGVYPIYCPTNGGSYCLATSLSTYLSGFLSTFPTDPIENRPYAGLTYRYSSYNDGKGYRIFTRIENSINSNVVNIFTARDGSGSSSDCNTYYPWEIYLLSSNVAGSDLGNCSYPGWDR